ncbi:MAG: hypothetical protein HYV33_01575 [Candidatus Kerfeldbacteria bacterium]|nr:hypothetical protein [Candidatus Kerfeldbacteria bacterium]
MPVAIAELARYHSSEEALARVNRSIINALREFIKRPLLEAMVTEIIVRKKMNDVEKLITDRRRYGYAEPEAVLAVHLRNSGQTKEAANSNTVDAYTFAGAISRKLPTITPEEAELEAIEADDIFYNLRVVQLQKHDSTVTIDGPKSDLAIQGFKMIPDPDMPLGLVIGRIELAQKFNTEKQKIFFNISLLNGELCLYGMNFMSMRRIFKFFNIPQYYDHLRLQILRAMETAVLDALGVDHRQFMQVYRGEI